MDKKYTLLMTACVEPTATSFSPKHRLDALTRLNDYIIALNYWLSYPQAVLGGIVFVENSMFDLQPLKKLVAENNTRNLKIEFLQQSASKIPYGLHYGYSELEMIDYAFENSKIIDESDYVIKATGRLYFPTLVKLLNRLPKDYGIAIDSRDYDFFKYKKHYLVTTIFIVQKDFYNRVLNNAKSKMIPGITGHIERMYYCILKPMYINNPKGIVLRYPFSMNPIGFGAHWNVNYSSRKKLLASGVRDLFRILLPDFWV